MKFVLSLSIIVLFLVQTKGFGQTSNSIIPKPNNISLKEGYFVINPATSISYQSKDNLEELADYLKTSIVKPSGFLLNISKSLEIKNSIQLILSEEEQLDTEAYILNIDTSTVKITAATEIGLFYGIQTLKQLLPPEIESKVIVNNIDLIVPCIEINDAPKFAYRGMHLDVGRHMFPVAFIKKFIDIMAMHKMNTFHWHLTEDQGWRIEIKKYPNLTKVGAYRDETIVGHKNESSVYDGKRYGGFYTQEEVKEIVSYASSRMITVIPEIEMPGHSVAALASYPDLGCTGGPYKVRTVWGVEKDVYCAGKEETFRFLENVLTEVIALFPGKYIHIGGDECPKERWQTCEECQQRIKDEGLKDEHELQSYFITRMEKFLNSKGRKIIGWDEILEGGLAPDATVMSWRGTVGGIEAAQSEHDVIMTPVSHCYFDYYQADSRFESLAFGNYLPLKRVYNFNPIPKELEEKYHKYIKGAQANLWTEYMPTGNYVEYMMNPRIAALAEAIWSDEKDWENFNYRLQNHFKRLDVANINYSTGTFKLTIGVEFDESTMKSLVTINSEQYKPEIRYTLDGSDPHEASMLYTKPFEVNETLTIKAAHFKNNKQIRGITEKQIISSKAIGCSVTLKNPYHNKYNAGGNLAIVNGLTGSHILKDGYWQGYEAKDFEAVIDLKEITNISSIQSNFIQAYGSWVFYPEYVTYYGSIDGKKYNLISKIKNKETLKKQKAHIQDFTSSDINKDFRFIKVVAKNIGTCPKGHPGEGKKAWIFIDEVIIN